METLLKKLTVFANTLASSKYIGNEYHCCDDPIDLDVVVAKAQAKTKAEIGRLLLEILKS